MAKTKIVRQKTFCVDGLTYKSRKLYNYHMELKDYQNKGIIQSFVLDEPTEKTKSKYHAKKVLINDICFDSLMESRFYVMLCALQAEGKILGFEMQKKFTLLPSFKKNGKTYREIAYIADFVVQGVDKKIDVIDIKGLETPEFKLKHKMFEKFYPELTLTCYQYSATQGIWETLDEIKTRRRNAKKKAKSK